MTEEEQLELIEMNPHQIQFIENPTEKVLWTAIKKQVSVIRHIKKPSEELQEYAVNQKGDLIQFIRYPSENIQRLAITQSPDAIKYIENPSEELQLISMKNHAYPIAFIENPTKTAIFECFVRLSFKKDGDEIGFFYLRKEPIFLSLRNENKKDFLISLPAYQGLLKEKKYFSALLQYLIDFHTDWIEEFMNNLQPLTKEQEDIWKQIRLKTIL